ncbi:MAG: NADH-quinone oxidoreductase subunit J [Candidatus Dadabacteria bacterium]|nr:NADH-quinone oxidoreductase subunit J [Candidatus Dadabacteria bacterium]
METVVFYVFAALALTGALLVISFKNPVSSALSLVLTLFSTAVLFVLLLAHFIAVIQILVYAGAIMILFLFTVMFLNLKPEALNFESKNLPFKISVLLVVLLFVGYFASLGFKKGLSLSNISTSDMDGFGTVEGVGTTLFTDYLLPFELTSVLILVAIIGVVTIAKKRAS